MKPGNHPILDMGMVLIPADSVRKMRGISNYTLQPLHRQGLFSPLMTLYCYIMIGSL